MERPLFLGIVGLALAGLACGGTKATSGSGGAGGSASAAGGSDAAGGSGAGIDYETYALEIGPIDVPSGVERTQCVTKRLGNPEPILVHRIDNHLSALSHHMIIYTTNATEEVLEPQDCSPFLDTLDPTKGAPLMVSQKLEDSLQLPEGVAIKLEQNQMIRIELHYINTSASADQITATSTMSVLPDELFQHEAGFLFVGNPDISIPPMSQHTLGPSHFLLPGDYSDANFFAITGHTHQWGTDVQVETADASGATVDSVYAPADFSWEEPETVQHDPPFSVPQGGGFNFTCSWNNQSTDTVSFGESANQEMCFFWAYYYPNQGAKVCFHTDQVAGGLDLCCPGNFLCDQLF